MFKDKKMKYIKYKGQVYRAIDENRQELEKRLEILLGELPHFKAANDKDRVKDIEEEIKEIRECLRKITSM